MRPSEAIGDSDPKHPRPPLTWDKLNFARGTITVTDHKTSEERTWVMDPSTTRALLKWKARSNPKPKDSIFTGVDSRGIANRLRKHLELAHVTRPELFVSSATRRQMRVHDLRGTFVTLSLANGRSEAWVMDRTGHNDSQMVNLYRRASRTAEEAQLGSLTPLDEAIPELRDLPEATAPRGCDRTNLADPFDVTHPSQGRPELTPNATHHQGRGCR